LIIKSAGKLIVSALIISLLVIPTNVSAKERRGADLVVTRLDGSQVGGELIAVKRDSLLLSSFGRDESVDIVDIMSIRIVRKSRAGKGALYGFLGGALIGVLGGIGGVDEYSAGGSMVLFGGFFGLIGSLGGLGVGAIMGVDTTISIAGEPEARVQRQLDKLRSHARVPRLPGSSPSAR
jgi:hypothetical protein